MLRQKHQIRRQVIELQFPEKDQGQRYHAVLSDICHRQIIPLIDRTCSALSEPDRIHRIPLLQIDLGEVNLYNLEADLMTKLGRVLPEALTRQMRNRNRSHESPEPEVKTASRLELFSVYIQTGSLPWWADPLQPALLDNLLQELIRDAPTRLMGLMPVLVRESTPLHRLVLQHDDDVLATLCGLYAPALEMDLRLQIREMAVYLHSSKVAAYRSESRLRQIVWRGMLQTVILRPERAEDQTIVWKETLLRTAEELDVTYAALVKGIFRHLQDLRTGRLSHWRKTVEHLNNRLSVEHTGSKELIRSLEKIQSFQVLPSGALKLLGTLIDRLPRNQAAHLQNDLFRSSRQLTEDERLLIILQALRRAIIKDSLPPDPVRHLVNKLQSSQTGSFSSAISNELKAILQECFLKEVNEKLSEDKTAVDTTFSSAEQLFVNNSGLVILWPFLERFFEYMGLTEGKRFKDEEANQRAVGLLQYIVTEETDPPEFLLPLNKILCGMAPTGVFDFGSPVTADEAEECNRLIEAVIANAPILKKMTITGFRNTFLVRKGLLGARDGNWLLNVERESFDVVLDRFPWEFGWVKLPWMEAPLRVEW